MKEDTKESFSDLLLKFMDQKINKFNVGSLEDKQNLSGLLPVAVPTGAGKTYNARKEIELILPRILKENEAKDSNNNEITYYQDRKKIFYMSPLKKNIDTKSFLDDPLLNNDVLYLDNTIQTIKTFFYKYENKKSFLDDQNIKKTFEVLKGFNVGENFLNKLKDCLISLHTEIRQIFNLENAKGDFTEDISFHEKKVSKYRTDLARIFSAFFNQYYSLKAYEDKSDIQKNISENIKARYYCIDNSFPWLIEIFPEINYFRKTIILMTVKKFCYPIKTIIGPTLTTLSASENELNLLKNNYIFMDEFNSVKEDLFNYLTEISVENPEDLFSVMQKRFVAAQKTTEIIYATEFYTSTYGTQPDLYNYSKNHDFKYHIDVVNEKTILKGVKYTLTNNFKLDKNENLPDKNKAIFGDNTYHEINDSNIYNFFIEQKDNVKGINFITFYKKKTNENKDPVIEAENQEIDKKIKELTAKGMSLVNFINDSFYEINAVNNLIKSHEAYYPFIPNDSEGLSKIIMDYRTYDKEKYRENFIYLHSTGQIQTRESTSSLISHFVNKDELLTKTFLNLKHLRSNYKHGKLGFERAQIEANNYYNKGVNFCVITENKNSKDQDKLEEYNLCTSPEKLLINLIRKNYVIGMSATADIMSVLCNFNLNLLETYAENKEIKIDYFTTEEKKALAEAYKRETSSKKAIYEYDILPSHKTLANCLKQKYENNNPDFINELLEVIRSGTKIDLNDIKVINNIKSLLRVRFSKVINLKENAHYYQARYLNHLYLFLKFLNDPDLHNILIFNTALPRDNSESFDKEILEDLFKLADFIYKHRHDNNISNINTFFSLFDIDSHFVILNSEKEISENGKINYSSAVDNMKEKLAQNDKVVILTSYRTTETGVNGNYIPKFITDPDAFIYLGEQNENLTRDEKLELIKTDPRYQTVDINAIALFDLTHLLPKVSGNDYKEKARSKLKCLSTHKELEAEGADEEYLNSFFYNNIAGANTDVKSFSREQSSRNINIRNKIINTFIQSTGRLSRSFRKFPKTKLFYADLFAIETDNFIDLRNSDSLQTPLISTFIDYLNAHSIDKDDPEKVKERNKYEQKIKKILVRWGNSAISLKTYFYKTYLRGIRERNNEDEKINLIKNYNKIRDFVVKHPTLQDDDVNHLQVSDSPIQFGIEEKDIVESFYFHTKNELRTYEFDCKSYNEDDFLNQNASVKIRLKSENIYFPDLPMGKEKHNEALKNFIPIQLTEESSKLQELLKCQTIADYFSKNNICESWNKKPDYIMSPTLYYVYLGRIGEIAGEAFFQKYISESLNLFNLKLEELEPRNFEMFDYRIGNKVFIDFKFWKGPLNLTERVFESNIISKAEFIRKKYLEDNLLTDKDIMHIFVINIMPVSSVYKKSFSKLLTENICLHVVQRLVDPDTHQDDVKIIGKLTSELVTILKTDK